MGHRPIHGMDVDTEALGKYLETVGKALQRGDVFVQDVYENRNVPDTEDALEIQFGLEFVPCDGVELGTGVPYGSPELDGGDE